MDRPEALHFLERFLNDLDRGENVDGNVLVDPDNARELLNYTEWLENLPLLVRSNTSNTPIAQAVISGSDFIYKPTVDKWEGSEQ